MVLRGKELLISGPAYRYRYIGMVYIVSVYRHMANMLQTLPTIMMRGPMDQPKLHDNHLPFEKDFQHLVSTQAKKWPQAHFFYIHVKNVAMQLHWWGT